MKMKLVEIDNISKSLGDISECILPPKICYSIAYNKKNIEEQAELYNQEKNKIILRYAVKDESGDPIGEDIGDGQTRYNIENAKDFTEELHELDETVVDIDIKTVSAYQIETATQDEKYSQLSVKQYSIISFMLED